MQLYKHYTIPTLSRKDFKNFKQTSHFYYLEESSLYFLR